MNLDIDLTREQIVEVISTIFKIEREHQIKWPSLEHAVLEQLAYQLHMAIKPTREEWSKTAFFNTWTKEAQENYLRTGT